LKHNAIIIHNRNTRYALPEHSHKTIHPIKTEEEKLLGKIDNSYERKPNLTIKIVKNPNYTQEGRFSNSKQMASNH
jgi:hypothetical protein